jgi:DNA-binding transcriptional ArsR family regulator
MTTLFQDRDMAAAVADKLRVFAQPQRLMILSCLLQGERTVAEIGEVTGISQPALSQQLAELRRAELVVTRKAAKQVWYDLAGDGVTTCLRTLEQIFCGGEPGASAIDVLPSTRKAPAQGLAQGVAAFARLVR